MKTILAMMLTVAAATVAGAAHADEPVAPAAAQPAPAPPTGAPAPATPPSDQAPPAMTPEKRRECFAELSTYTWNPKADRPGVDTGDKFRAALAKCDDLLAVANQRAAMHEVHDHEAKVFARAKKFVIAAYGVLWVVLILFVVVIFIRQRKFNRMISDLEAKLRRAEGGGAATGG